MGVGDYIHIYASEQDNPKRISKPNPPTTASPTHTLSAFSI